MFLSDNCAIPNCHHGPCLALRKRGKRKGTGTATVTVRIGVISQPHVSHIRKERSAKVAKSDSKTCHSRSVLQLGSKVTYI